MEQTPAAFACGNVPRVHKPVDLVHVVVSLLLIIFTYSGHNTIWSFIDIFVEILDCHDHRADFNIDVGVILGGHVRVIRNDSAVINVHSVFLLLRSRIPSSVQQVAIVRASRHFTELLGELFSAFALFHEGDRGLAVPHGPCIMFCTITLYNLVCDGSGVG